MWREFMYRLHNAMFFVTSQNYETEDYYVTYDGADGFPLLTDSCGILNSVRPAEDKMGVIRT